MNAINFGIFSALFVLIFTLSMGNVYGDLVPEWVKNTAKWYGEGSISETEFLNAIKFLIEQGILQVDLGITADEGLVKQGTANVILPNGNSKMGNSGFYIPLNLNARPGTTIVWINDDTVGHTIQSQDGEGNVISLFNSGLLKTGDRFAHKFEESGVYNYFCTIHPWRVGVITITQ